ncbi:MAG TPA: AI-2E family transporter [Candidatus Polarisedimenticolia bacterium]|nr:AI-2E family transporter [Candidatus Polarisedimenticolia bacterium]
MLAVFAGAWAAQLARPVLLPIVLAVLIAIVLTPLVGLLGMLRLPAPAGAFIVVALFAGGIGYGVYALSEPAADWLERAPETMREVEIRLRALKASMAEARAAAESVEKMASVDGEAPPAEVTVREPSITARAVRVARTLLLRILEVLLLVYFLLAFGGPFYRRLLRIPDGRRGKLRIVQITTEIQREVSSYLLTVSIINVGLGIATTLATSLLGMPNPLLWGVMATVLNFVPYLGSAVTLIVLTIVAILTYDSLARALLVPLVFLGIATIEGQLVTPIIVGRRMSLSPMVIVVALLVGDWMWGVVGMLIAVPVLAVFKILCSHDERLAPIAELLGTD